MSSCTSDLGQNQDVMSCLAHVLSPSSWILPHRPDCENFFGRNFQDCDDFASIGKSSARSP